MKTSLGPEMGEGREVDVVKKEALAIVRGMSIVMAVLILTGLATSQGDALPDVASDNIFRVLVNYDLRMDDGIRDGKYDWVNDGITEKNFPITKKGTAELDIVLVHLGRISSEDAIKELNKLGLRPAKVRELLAFGVKYPDEQKKYTIVALGSVWQGSHGNRFVPYLWGRDHLRFLQMDWFESDWYVNCRFAGVRK